MAPTTNVPHPRHRGTQAISASCQAIAILNSHGTIVRVNPPMAAAHGFVPSELCGQHFSDLFIFPNEQTFNEASLPALRAGRLWQARLEAHHSDGSALTVDVCMTPMHDSDGSLSQIVCHCRYLSDGVEPVRQLSWHEESLEVIFNRSPVLIAYVDKEYRYKFVNNAYREFVGRPRSEIIGAHVTDMLNMHAFEQARKHMDAAMHAGREAQFELQVPHASGKLTWVRATYVPDLDCQSVARGVYAFILDIEALKQEEIAHRTLLHAVDRGMEGLALHDADGIFMYVNPSQANMYGYQPYELIGKSWKQLYDVDQIREIESIHIPRLQRDGQWRGELRGLKKTGESFDVEVSLTLVGDEDGSRNGLFCSCRDISERKRAREEVDFLAFHDHLTGLANRTFFKERLEHAIEFARQRDTLVAVMFIDLDHFKHVNDTLGHSAGDQLLQAIASRIRSIFRDEDIVARLSGDEFTVALVDLTARQAIEALVEKLMQTFAGAVHVAGREIYQGASVGISVFPDDGQDVESLMKNADAAMYRAKEEGRDSFRFYTPALTDSSYERMLLRTHLRSALEGNEFELYYQPVVNLETERLVGFEALLRWHHPELGLVSPDKFIAHAEESNLIIPIGFWVVEQGARQAKRWLEQGLRFETIAINVSGVQLQGAFAEGVAHIIADVAIAPSLLELEITETFIMRGLRRPVSQLKQLRSMGIRLAIDDFGVGYSSLSQLKQLPTQRLKIDRSFVGDIVEDADDLAIVEAIIALGKTLQLDITAEGVETEGQHRLLRRLGCQSAQGYFYARPSPASEIPEAIARMTERLTGK